MHCELAEDGEEHVGTKDVGMWPGGGEGLKRASMGDEQEEGSSKDPIDGSLHIPKFDAIQVHYA